MGKAMAVSIVCIPVLPGDRENAAQAASALIPNALARHYFDPDRQAGRELAGQMGGHGQIAWDLYLFFPAMEEVVC